MRNRKYCGFSYSEFLSGVFNSSNPYTWRYTLPHSILSDHLSPLSLFSYLSISLLSPAATFSDRRPDGLSRITAHFEREMHNLYFYIPPPQKIYSRACKVCVSSTSSNLIYGISFDIW